MILTAVSRYIYFTLLTALHDSETKTKGRARKNHMKVLLWRWTGATLYGITLRQFLPREEAVKRLTGLTLRHGTHAALAGWLCPPLWGCICHSLVLWEPPGHTPCLKVLCWANHAFGRGWLRSRELRTDTKGASAFWCRAPQTQSSSKLPMKRFSFPRDWKQSCSGILSSPKSVHTVVINNNVTVKPALTPYNLRWEI